MIRKSLRPADRDRFQRRAGLALYESAPTNGALALATGQRPETTSRHRNARRPNTVSRFLEMVHLLSSSPDTTPYALIAEAQTTALEGRMAGMDKRALVRRYWILKDEEADALRNRAAAEIAAARTGDLEALETAEGAVAAAATEAAALIRLLLKHDIDPRDPQWRR